MNFCCLINDILHRDKRENCDKLLKFHQLNTVRFENDVTLKIINLKKEKKGKKHFVEREKILIALETNLTSQTKALHEAFSVISQKVKANSGVRISNNNLLFC